jgi:nuclear transport factor 2 (NTF2) superfamily protein
MACLLAWPTVPSTREFTYRSSALRVRYDRCVARPKWDQYLSLACAHRKEHWEFDEAGLMRLRGVSANDYEIT